MGTRRAARESALRILYEIEFNDAGAEAALARESAGEASGRKSLEYAGWLIRGVSGRRDEIDGLIESTSAHWRIPRMAPVDRNILRMAVFEMLEEPFLAPAIIINEAIEIARRFSGDAAAAVRQRRPRRGPEEARRGSGRDESEENPWSQSSKPPPNGPQAGGRPERKSDQDLAREDKFRRLAAEGVEPFPHTAHPTHSVTALVASHAGLSREELEARKDRVVGRRPDPVHPPDGPGRLLPHLRRPLPAPGLPPLGRRRAEGLRDVRPLRPGRPDPRRGRRCSRPGRGS